MHRLLALVALLAGLFLIAPEIAVADTFFPLSQLDSGNILKFRNPLTNTFVTLGTVSGGTLVPSAAQVVSGLGFTPLNQAATTLPSTFTTSSLTSVGTLTTLNVAGASSFAGNVHNTGTAALDTTYASASNVSPSNVSAVSPGGVDISICTIFSCGAGFDHIRTGQLAAYTTSDDGHSQEDGITLLFQSRTGYDTAWAKSTAYSLGYNVANYGGIYRVTTAGTSASSGIGPTGTGTSITDGSVVWSWVNASAIDGKVGYYNETGAYAGAGATWAQSINFQLQPGHIPVYDTNTEFDLYNAAGNCVIGSCNVIGLAVLVSGPYQSTVAELFSGNGTLPLWAAGTAYATNAQVTNGAYTYKATTGGTAGSSGGPTGTASNSSWTDGSVTWTNVANASTEYSVIWGLRLAGNFFSSQADIEIDTSSPIGISIGGNVYGTYYHSIASIQDSANGPYGIIENGAHSAAAILVNSPGAATSIGFQAYGNLSNSAFNDSSNAPLSYSSSGTHTTATFNDGSTSPYSLVIGGAHATAAMVVNSTVGVGVQILGIVNGQAFNDGSNAPVSFYSSGTHTTATFNDGATSPYSFLIGGTHSSAGIVFNGSMPIGIQFLSSYTTAQISGLGWKVDGSGNLTALSEAVTATTASTSTATGAIVDAGGLGVAGAAYFGGSVSSGGGTGSGVAAGVPAFLFANYNASGAGPNLIGVGSGAGSAGLGNGSNGDFDFYGGAGGFRFYINGTVEATLSNAGVFNLPVVVASTSKTTGAIVNAGGEGIAGALYVGGLVNVAGTFAEGVSGGASATGLTQSGATTITQNVTRFTTVTSTNDAAVLSALIGIQMLIYNNGTVALLVFPPSGAQILYFSGTAITTGAANAAYSVAVGAAVNFVCISTTVCLANP